jgi:hypothetical protein
MTGNSGKTAKQLLKDIFNIKELPDSELYILLGIFALIIILGVFKII